MKRVDIISKVVGRDSSGKPIGGGISIPMGNYALKSDFESLKKMFNDFLEGDDTDSVINRWKDLEAFLNGISEDNTLDSILKAYVTLSGTQTITGEKNFVGGLKVNGSPIYYDTEKKYWKLEGDLLVTGGVTMYGNDSDFVASTIMDAIAVDGTTISKEGGILKVIGSDGGATTLGSLANVGSWADSVANQDRIMYQAANSSQWVAKNLSDLAVGGVTGNYLPLSGGTLTGSLEIKSNSSYVHFKDNNGVDRGSLGVLEDNNASVWKPSKGWKILLDTDNYSSYALPLSGGTLTNTLTIDNSNVGLILHRSGQATPYIRFGQDANNEWGELGVYNDGRLVFGPLVSSQGGYGQWNTVWHSGNDGSGSGLDADMLDGKHYSDIVNGNVASSTKSTYSRYIGNVGKDGTTWYDTEYPIYFQWGGADGNSLYIKCSNYPIISTAATRLETARTIWGQSFNGTGNVDGQLVINASTTYPIRIIQSYSSAWASAFLATNSSLTAGQHYTLDFGYSTSAYNAAWVGYYHAGVGSTSNRLSMGLNSTDDVINILGTGNVGIGTTNPLAKLQVEGLVKINAPLGGTGLEIVKDANNTSSINLSSTSTDLWQISARYTSSENGNLKIYYYDGSTWANPLSINKSGNILVSGGITMYSARKLKNITDERGLSLEELSVIKPTRFTWKDGRDDKVHIGGIADDVQKVLPEVIYKADNDTLTMDYGNAAFAIAASLIKPVITHEEEIKALKVRIKELEEQVKTLSWNIA